MQEACLWTAERAALGGKLWEGAAEQGLGPCGDMKLQAKGTAAAAEAWCGLQMAPRPGQQGWLKRDMNKNPARSSKGGPGVGGSRGRGAWERGSRGEGSREGVHFGMDSV